jgi:hypothetical protein
MSGDKHLTTEHLVFDSHTRNIGGESGATLTLRGEALRLVMTHSEAPISTTNRALVYHTIGMRGVGRQHAQTDVGDLYLTGVAKLESFDEIAGQVVVKSVSDEDELDDWIERTDELVRNVLTIVSLADGKPLPWSIRQLYVNSQLIRTDLYGPSHTGRPEDNVFHFLNLPPVLKLAVDSYTPALRRDTGIELAIALFLAQPIHIELRLVAAMTALEHLVSVYNKSHPISPPLEQSVFEKVRGRLIHTFDDAVTELPSDDELRRRFRRVRDRIGNLNHVTFKDKLWQMLDEYQVPLSGIDGRINAAIDARHKIIHTGQHDVPFAAFHLHVAVLRELLKRIFLKLLRYEGKYQSYLNGPKWVDFPPTDVEIAD